MTTTLNRCLAATLLLALAGCGEASTEAIVRDHNGCEWKVRYRVHWFGADVAGFDDVQPRLDREGRQFCEVLKP
jgi:hypothetical protein